MLRIWESLKPLCGLRRRGVGMYSTMQPLVLLSCMRWGTRGDRFRGTQQIYKKANVSRTLSRIERNFLRYRSFFPFYPNGSHISFLSHMLRTYKLFILYVRYIRILTYMTFFIYNFFICVPYGWLPLFANMPQKTPYFTLLF